MNLDKDVILVSVKLEHYSEFTHQDGTHFLCWTYFVLYKVKGKVYKIPLQKTIKNGEEEQPYVFKAHLTGALEFLYGIPITRMGKNKGKYCNELARYITRLAKKEL